MGGTAIEHGVNEHGVLGPGVVHRERKAFGEQAVILAEKDTVDARVKLERINIREERIEEVCAKPRTLPFVEFPSICQIPLGGVENEYPHDWPERRFFAASQSVKVALPEARCSARS